MTFQGFFTFHPAGVTRKLVGPVDIDRGAQQDVGTTRRTLLAQDLSNFQDDLLHRESLRRPRYVCWLTKAPGIL